MKLTIWENLFRPIINHTVYCYLIYNRHMIGNLKKNIWLIISDKYINVLSKLYPSLWVNKCTVLLKCFVKHLNN